MTDRPVVLIIPPHLGAFAGMLGASAEVVKLWEQPPPEVLARTRAIVTAGEFALRGAVTDAMPDLGLVACIGVGYDGVDLDWARSRGVAVTAARDVNQHDVADHALGLILASRRRILEGDRAVRSGGWTPESRIITPSINGQKLGVVGLGGIGAALATRAEALRMNIRWYGPRPKPEAPWTREEDLMALARWSDVLVVAARPSEENRGLISAGVIAAVGADGLLVNISRGQMVDENALIAALREGRLGAAALDVFADEPTDPARWADVPNTILTPHMAGATREAVQGMVAQLMGNLRAFLAGEALVEPVVAQSSPDAGE